MESDAQLIRRVLAGDNEAFTALIENIRKAFTRWLGGELVIFILLKKSSKTRSFGRTKDSQN